MVLEKGITICVAVCTILLLLFQISSAESQSYTITSSLFDEGGGKEFSNGDFSIRGAIGQTFIGLSYSIDPEGYDVYTAYLYTTDIDGDEIIDIRDVCPREYSAGLDANIDGCIDRIGDFSDIINNLSDEELRANMKNSLLSKIENAIAALERGKDNAAVNILNAFINQVNAQSGKKISEDTAIMLVGFAENIVAQI